VSRYPDPETLDAIAVEVVRSSFPFDICCTHTLTEHGAACRCQLWAGHEGDDAVMFVRDGERLVRTWHGQDPSTARDCADYRNLPWARGFPVPAWRDNAANDG
jgi:hypothetical protein